MKKLLSIAVLAIAITFCFSACGGGDTDSGSSSAKSSGAEDEGTVVLVDSGYSVKSSDSDVYAYWGAVMKNENKSKAYEFSKFIITAYDDKDEVLATEDQTMGLIQPGEVQAFGSMLDCNGEKPAKVEIVVEPGDESSVDDEDIISSDFEVTGTNEKVDSEFGEYAYTGKIKNNSKVDAEDVLVTVLIKKDGKIVYGTNSYVENVKAGGEKPFDISEYDIPEHDEFEVKASQWM